MAFSTGRDPMDSGSIIASISLARVDRGHLSTIFPVLDDTAQRKGDPEVAVNSGEVHLPIPSSADTSDSLNSS